MNQLKTCLFFSIFAIAITSACKKTSTSTPDQMFVPWDLDTLMPSHATYSIGLSKLNVTGVLVACKLTGNVTDTYGHPLPYARNSESVFFKFNPSDSYTGGVSGITVNGTVVDRHPMGYFNHGESTPVWVEGTTNHWHVSGSSTIPIIDADVAGTMPEFTGTFPATIDRSTDFSFAFNASNTAHADSAVVILYGGSGPLFGSVVSAAGGTSVVPSSRMTTAVNCTNTTLTGWEGDPNHYSGGLILVVLYNHTIRTIGGKQFAFVNQREYLTPITYL